MPKTTAIEKDQPDRMSRQEDPSRPSMIHRPLHAADVPEEMSWGKYADSRLEDFRRRR